MQTLRLFRGKTLRGRNRPNYVIENFGEINNIDDWYIPFFPNEPERYKGIATCDNRSITIEDTKNRIIYMLSFSMIRILLLGKNCDVPCSGYTIVKMHAAKRREIVLDALLRVERLEIDDSLMQKVVPREMSLATLQTSSKLALDCAGKDSSDKYFNYIREYKKRLTTLSTKSSRDRIYSIWVKMFSEAMYGRETVLKLLSIEQAIDELCPVVLPPFAIKSLIEIDADANMEMLTEAINSTKIAKKTKSKTVKKIAAINKTATGVNTASRKKAKSRTKVELEYDIIKPTEDKVKDIDEIVKVSEEAPKKRKGRRKSKKEESTEMPEIELHKQSSDKNIGKVSISKATKTVKEVTNNTAEENIDDYPELDMYSADPEISDPFSSYMEALAPEENDMLGDDDEF